MNHFIEPLESRTLCDAKPYFALTDRVLYVRGSEGGDRIRLFQLSKYLLIQNDDDIVERYTRSKIDTIVFFGGSKNDDFKVDGIRIPVLAYGNSGKDTLVGGSSSDTLVGGDGQDSLRGGRGDDLLFGGSNDDTLSGGENDDILFGGANRDRLKGDGGDDTVVGATAGDRLQDTFVLEAPSTFVPANTFLPVDPTEAQTSLTLSRSNGESNARVSYAFADTRHRVFFGQGSRADRTFRLYVGLLEYTGSDGQQGSTYANTFDLENVDSGNYKLRLVGGEGTFLTQTINRNS